jgi:RHS repeat-associated protein
VRYYHQDALGSVLALTDEAGAVRTRYNYEPFGETAYTGEESDQPFQYTAREHDGGGLQHYRARYKLDHRFISEDPIGFAGGDVNLYVYVRNLPTRYRDPYGLQSGFMELAKEIAESPAGQYIVDKLSNMGGPGLGDYWEGAKDLWDAYQDALDRNQGYPDEKKAVRGCHPGN